MADPNTLTSPTDVFDPGPPDDATIQRTVDAFAAEVRARYPGPISFFALGAFLGSEEASADIHLAVVFPDGEWDEYGRMEELSFLGFDMLMEHGALVSGLPVASHDWRETPHTLRYGLDPSEARQVA